MKTIEERLADELGAPLRPIKAALALLAEGRSVAFIARYRKEATRGLDEDQLRRLAELHQRETRLEDRRKAILEKMNEKGVDDADLLQAIRSAETLAVLEELYGPWKSSRKTRADAAREAGLEPLSDALVDPGRRAPAERLAARFVDVAKGIASASEAVDGAVDILVDRLRKNPLLRPKIREIMNRGRLFAKKKRGFDGRDRRFDDLMDQSIPLDRLPGHRLLAMQRGDEAGALSIGIEYDLRAATQIIASALAAPSLVRSHPELRRAVEHALDKHISLSIEREILAAHRERAEREAAEVFGRNLRSALLAAPLGARPVLALDPGYRAGCKMAVIGPRGEVGAWSVVYPTPPQADVEGAKRKIVELIERHEIEVLAIGNGQGARETMSFLRQEVVPAFDAGKRPELVFVSEAGASVYSASAEAAAELPELDVSFRGAVSIGRRLQDPLAELVKIDPRSLGLGQYQHDVDQSLLSASLDIEVECAVAAVGVELSTASPALLARVPGLSSKLARTIVDERERNGPPRSRGELRDLKGLGPVTFENCAGFLRIEGPEPLDRTGIHPESYGLVERIAALRGVDKAALIGTAIVLDPDERAALSDIGAETLADVLEELREPGRDPRAEFRNVQFREDVTQMSDLRPGLALEGVVTNVTEFGAFCDIGIEKDGLLHISRFPDRREPHVGDILKLKVVEVDPERGRIALDLRS